MFEKDMLDLMLDNLQIQREKFSKECHLDLGLDYEQVEKITYLSADLI